MTKENEFDKVKKNLEAIKDTVNSGAPQANKNRRIINLVKNALAEIAEVEKLLAFIKDYYKGVQL